MHIILTTNFSPWSPYSGGGQRSTHNLATALTERGHRVDVIYTKAPLEKIIPSPGVSYQVHWACFPTLRSRRASWLRNFSIYSVRKLASSLVRKSDEKDILIHSNGEEGALFPLKNDHQTLPFVLTSRYPRIPDAVRYPSSSTLGCFSHIGNTKYHLLGKALQQADLCCTTSRSALGMLHHHFRLGETDQAVIPNGVDSLFLDAASKNNFKGPLLFFGRLARSKGVDTLIEALAHLDSSPQLIVVGRGEWEKKLRQLAHELGVEQNITFRSWMSQQQLKRTLEKASVAVLPSREESFGNTMAEAMATGTPVISTTAGSIPEVVIDGTTGLLVPPENPRALAQSISDLLRHPEQAARMGANGRERVRRHFTWPSVARTYEQQYQKLL